MKGVVFESIIIIKHASSLRTWGAELALLLVECSVTVHGRINIHRRGERHSHWETVACLLLGPHMYDHVVDPRVVRGRGGPGRIDSDRESFWVPPWCETDLSRQLDERINHVLEAIRTIPGVEVLLGSVARHGGGVSTVHTKRLVEATIGAAAHKVLAAAKHARLALAHSRLVALAAERLKTTSASPRCP